MTKQPGPSSKRSDEISAQLRRAKASFFREKIDSANSTAAYWKVLSEAKNPKRRPQIGPIRREDNTLAVREDEKANQINTFFATVRTSLSRNTVCPPVEIGNDPTLTQTISTISISEESISRKFKALKPNKAGGPDEVTPKLLLSAEPAVVPSLTKLYSISVNNGKVFKRGLRNSFGGPVLNFLIMLVQRVSILL